MGVMSLNEEVEEMLYYVGSSKAVKMLTEGSSTERALGWVKQANKMYLVASCSPLDRASLYFGRADHLTFLGCCF